MRSQNIYAVTRREEDVDIVTPTRNHFTEASKAARVKMARLNLNRVAGNIYECPSTKDFWKVKGDKIVRISKSEVDNGERIQTDDGSFTGIF